MTCQGGARLKLNVTVFLLKTDSDLTNSLDISAANSVTIPLGADTAVFYWSTKCSRPKWVGLFESVQGADLSSATITGVRGLIVFERHERVFCFTFGHARHFIDPTSIERYFGLKVALSMSDPGLIKSIDKTNIERLPLRSRDQSSKYIALSEFEFRFDWEILKSLTSVVRQDTDDYEMVSGSDSVSLYTDIVLQDIPEIADRLWSAYHDDSYKEKYPWIDYIVPVRDKALIQTLNNQLVDMVNRGEYSSVWAAPPSMVDFNNFSGFCYRRPRGGSQPCTSPDLDLSNCLQFKGIEGNVQLSQLKSTKVYLYNADSVQVDCWSLFLCINGELNYQEEFYLLSEGDWYRIDSEFSDAVNAYLDQFPRSEISFPNYRNEHERPYLERICRDNGFHLMDRKNVKPNGATSPIEFCDLLTPSHDLIHVKKYSSSSVLSHFFSQAYVSAETLLREPAIVDQVNDHLREEGSFQFHFDNEKHPRESKIILAIMQAREGDLHMPFFSKVNFRQYSQKIRNMGFTVELAKIAR